VVSCQHCGAQATDGRVMCPSCRRRMQAAPPPVMPSVAPPPPVEPAGGRRTRRPLWRRRAAVIPAAGVLVVGGAVGGAFALVGPSSSPSAGPSPSAAPTGSAATKAPAPPKPQHYHGPLTRIAITTPHGWKRQGHVNLSVKLLARNFKRPGIVQNDLRALGYHRGVDIEVYRPSPRIVVNEQLWQFRTTDGASGWYAVFLRANTPHSGSTYAHTFRIKSAVPGRGYLCRARDSHGYSYGVAVARVDNIIVHVRYAALPKVTKAQVTSYLRRAVQTAVREAHLRALIS
jgi:hypothetical protein